jgi:hypothetical protein
MEIVIPSALKSLASAGSAISELAAWRKRARGDARSIIGELKDNLSYLDLVADDAVPLGDVVGKISVREYRRLATSGYDFNGLKKARIKTYASLKGTELESWSGKTTEELVESIYDKISELIIRYPHVSNNRKYRWAVRVNNIRKRIWLLLRHVQD